MFSSGQLIFAIAFVIGFIILATVSYRKDRKLHRKYYRNSKAILVGFLVFLAILLTLKLLLTK